MMTFLILIINMQSFLLRKRHYKSEICEVAGEGEGDMKLGVPESCVFTDAMEAGEEGPMFVILPSSCH